MFLCWNIGTWTQNTSKILCIAATVSIYSRNIRYNTAGFQFVLEDSIPLQLKSEGAVDISTTRHDSGVFSKSIDRKVESKKGEIFLLLGGIGSGKTTFLKRYQNSHGKHLLEKTIWFHLDFLAAPLSVESMENFVWQLILDQIRQRYADKDFETRQNIKGAFSDKIKILKETILIRFSKDSKEYNDILSENLQMWTGNVSDYVPRLLNQIRLSWGKTIFLFIDNVDQFRSEYQASVFLLAQKISKDLNSLTIISLREESYFSPNVQKIFTAYTNKKYHISSPQFRPLINKRIDYVLQKVLNQTDISNLPREIQHLISHKEDLVDFLYIIQESIFQENKNIAIFIDSICFGNMRLALQMFSTFLCSGTTDVDKMLRIYRRDGYYSVAFHEWVKSIVLGDRFYYKESQSSIMNVFDCGIDKNSSHFTSLRILKLLSNYQSQKTLLGEGYREIAKVCNVFEETFDNFDDVVNSLNRMTRFQLVELNDKSTETIKNASHARISNAGRYYLNYLTNSFCYLDLILQDTPLASSYVQNRLFASIMEVDNLYDKEEEKLKRTQARFERVETFIDYLKEEEEKEFKHYEIGNAYSTFNNKFAYKIALAFIKEKEIITQRILKNLTRNNS